MKEHNQVRGHLCEGLNEYQEEGGGCVPRFDSEGNTDGCDDTNYTKIQYCPFCGTKLD